MAKVIKSVQDIVPDVANANRGTERGRYAVEASLRETGAGRSIVVDREGRIIAGNKTLESWADISGEIEIVKTDGTKLVVVQREDLDLNDVEGLARKLAYYDNRAGQLGLEWDAEQLLSDITAGIDLSGMFFDDEIAEILSTIDGYGEVETGNDPGADVSKADELQAKWQVSVGDIWQLGEHRIACGDCTDAAVVARVMGGEKADMVTADPPYGIGLDKDDQTIGLSKSYGRVEGDGDTQTAKRIFAAFGGIDAKQVWWGANHWGGSLLHESPCWFVWDKDHHGMTFADAELAWTSLGKPVRVFRHAWSGADRDSERGQERYHINQKPVALFVWYLESDTDAGAVILDPCCGAGGSIIACEQLGRKCRAVELHPPYVSVALERWHLMTGREPVRIE